MSLEQRVALMEKQLRIQGDFLQKVGAAIEERQGKDQATLDFSKILMESVQEHETRIQTLADALTQHHADLSLVTLVVYFLLQTLQTEYVVSVGTADAIMTSVEKHGDVKASLYYELFQVLREEEAGIGQ